MVSTDSLDPIWPYCNSPELTPTAKGLWGYPCWLGSSGQAAYHRAFLNSQTNRFINKQVTLDPQTSVSALQRSSCDLESKTSDIDNRVSASWYAEAAGTYWPCIGPWAYGKCRPMGSENRLTCESPHSCLTGHRLISPYCQELECSLLSHCE